MIDAPTGRIAVIGAGIGGLTTTIALQRIGLDVALYEQAPEAREVGAGIHLWSNAVRALREIGLDGTVEPLAIEVELEHIHKASGRRVVEWPVGAVGRAIGAPSIALTRPRLLRALLDSVERDALRHGSRLVSFAEDDQGVELRFEDGGTERCDLLIGADGLWSVVRAQLLGQSTPRYSGYTSWRTLVPEGDERGPATVRQHWGRGARFVDFRVGDGMRYCVALANATSGGQDPEEGARASLLRRFADFAEPVPSLIESASAWSRLDIADRRPVRHWGRGRVTLLGDAAHPMTPNTSQGAGMTIEDAAVLARLIAQRGPTPEALRAYELARRSRANSQITIAHFAGSLGRWTRPLAVRVRDKLFVELLFGGPAWKRQSQFISAPF